MQKIEDLMEIVKKLQKAGSLEPRIEFLINQINEVQQAKKKAIEELGEAKNVWDTLQKELDSLQEEKAHLKDTLNKKQGITRSSISRLLVTPQKPTLHMLLKLLKSPGLTSFPWLPLDSENVKANSETLRILQLHCQEKESEAQRKQTLLQECKERISSLNLQIEEERNKQTQLRLDFEEQLETLMDQHKDLWEFHRPEQLAREICALDSNKEQLLKEEKLIKMKLEDVKRQLCSLCGPEGPSTHAEGLFLRSQEAAAAVQLFKEENRKAEELLEAAAQHHQQLKQRCQQVQEKRQRLKEELEKYRVQTQSVQEEGVTSLKGLAVFEEKDPELSTKEDLIPPS